MRKIIAVFVCMVILSDILYAYADAGLSKSDLYEAGHEAILSEDEESLLEAIKFFEEAGAYMDARMYRMYAETLLYVLQSDVDNNLDKAMTNIEVLSDSPSFIESITAHQYPSIDDLQVYIYARKLEEKQDYEAAIAKYATIYILDSIDRRADLKNKEKEKKYEEAKQAFDEGRYYEAAKQFETLGLYNDSIKMRETALKLHKHKWTEATCENGSYCEECGEKGTPALGHSYANATCTTPKTCTRCGVTSGSALGHDYLNATCTTTGKCTRCSAIGSNPLGHDYADATCTAPKTCTRCGATSGSALGHKWQEATYERPKTCTRCWITEGEKLIREYKVGDYITFGHYEQDNNTSNGKEAIEWQVLEVSGDQVLLISKYGLDAKPYNTKKEIVTWETCTLRKWLNSDFYNAAFSADEKKLIVESTVSADKNPMYSTNPGNATKDKVYLLSVTEANKYFKDKNRQGAPTDYAIKNGARLWGDSVNVGEYEFGCWLRSPGNDGYWAAVIWGYSGGSDDCDVSSEGIVTNGFTAVQPVVRVRLS